MSVQAPEMFISELESRAKILHKYLFSKRFSERFNPKDMEEAVTLYAASGGKRLRPAILLWSCGALGGKEETAIPAAAAVEIFHTWTLVHDDIIDRDDMRRGQDTVHERFRKVAQKRFPALSVEEAAHYGVSVAVLAGDVQHGWGISMMTEMSRFGDLDPAVTLHLINDLDTEVLNLLVEGEILDLQFSHMPISSFHVEDIEDMLWKKTGVLYRFCARAGALIGLGKVEMDNPHVKALESFSSNCGIAFQHQDDVLGVIGNSKMLGKPVGSDIREGKRTTVILFAYNEADNDEKSLIEATLGNPDASEADVHKVVEILVRRGGVELTQDRAKLHLEKAYPQLDILPPSKYRDLLKSWADFMISRNR